MLNVESVRHCPTCDEVTSHSRRRIALLALFGSAAIVLGLGGLAFGRLEPLAAIAIALAGAGIVAWDRRRLVRIECGRCRDAERVRRRRTRPRLDGTTEIHIV
ncbi:MAG: hypothetical protein AAGA20_21655 [Planctomycetota bacterium]